MVYISMHLTTPADICSANKTDTGLRTMCCQSSDKLAARHIIDWISELSG